MRGKVSTSMMKILADPQGRRQLFRSLNQADNQNIKINLSDGSDFTLSVLGNVSIETPHSKNFGFTIDDTNRQNT